MTPPRLAIEELLAHAPTPQKVKAFLGAHKFPIVEGTSVTFVWHGHADAVTGSTVSRLPTR
jgi:hypothetical protein